MRANAPPRTPGKPGTSGTSGGPGNPTGRAHRWAGPDWLVWVRTALRVGLAGVLVVAGALKVLDPQTSVQAVRAYQLLPSGAETLVGWGLPFVEIALGLLLAAGLFTRAVAIAAATMFAVFVVAVASAALRGLSIDCGCFGGGGPVAAGQTRYAAEIVRDVGFWLAALWLACQPVTRLALDGHGVGSSELEQSDDPQQTAETVTTGTDRGATS